ncbi:MAG: GNAT family N-acetyltransferase [Anaerolineae bacterium]|nr:GNAT family N-acetyltransferase [Anaerolineae bacterium]
MSDNPITLLPASQLPHRWLATLINQAYADYFLPVSLDREQFANMCREEDIDLDNSIAALNGGLPVGLALLSVRGNQGWVSGVGVLPTWRRKGIARQMIQHLQTTASALGLSTLRLEVLKQNQRAILLYESLGFAWKQDLLVLTADPGYFKEFRFPDNAIQADPLALLVHYDQFHNATESPWQRSLPTLRNRAHQLQGLGIWKDHQLLGYIVYRIQPNHQAILDLAVRPTYPGRLAVAETLLVACHSLQPDKGGYIINCPSDDTLLPAFQRLHYYIWQQQQEMVWQVALQDSD